MKIHNLITERKLFFLFVVICAFFVFLSAKSNERPAWEQSLAVFLFWVFGILIKEIYLKYSNEKIFSQHPLHIIGTFWILLSITTLFFILKTFNLINF